MIPLNNTSVQIAEMPKSPMRRRQWLRMLRSSGLIILASCGVQLRLECIRRFAADDFSWHVARHSPTSLLIHR